MGTRGRIGLSSAMTVREAGGGSFRGIFLWNTGSQSGFAGSPTLTLSAEFNNAIDVGGYQDGHTVVIPPGFAGYHRISAAISQVQTGLTPPITTWWIPFLRVNGSPTLSDSDIGSAGLNVGALDFTGFNPITLIVPTQVRDLAVADSVSLAVSVGSVSGSVSFKRAMLLVEYLGPS